jgi:hypothetical protein
MFDIALGVTTDVDGCIAICLFLIDFTVIDNKFASISIVLIEMSVIKSVTWLGGRFNSYAVSASLHIVRAGVQGAITSIQNV